jgi:hypothetical protein
MIWIRLAVAFVVGWVVPAREIPVGTVIPVMLGSGLDAAKDEPGKKVEGRVMQKVPLPAGEAISQRSRIIGHVVKVTKPGSSGSSLAMKFDSLQEEGHTTPLTTGLLAVASAASVADAQVPVSVNSDMVPASQWVTRQVGGDVVRRGWGKVASRTGEVGTWLEGSSVLIKLTPNPSAGCPNGPGYDREQAVWIFSSAACGTYGLNDVKVGGSGGTPPLGDIVLTSTRNVDLRGGSGWLLIVVAETGH